MTAVILGECTKASEIVILLQGLQKTAVMSILQAVTLFERASLRLALRLALTVLLH